MTIDEMRNHEWSVSSSGGKDSTATIILMHETNIPINEINYVRMMYDENLPATLPIMTDFVDKTKIIFEEWGYKVNIIPSVKTARDCIKKVYYKSKNAHKNGNCYGITAFMRGHCKMTGVKQQTLKKVGASEYEMIGYACDEVKRIHRLSEKKCSIMCELNVTESDAMKICEKYNMKSPLYDLGLTRDGCWFCPNAGKREREFLTQYYPELYEKIINMIEMTKYDLYSLKSRNTWLGEYFREKEAKALDEYINEH